MFNVKNKKVLSIGVSALVLAATFGYAAFADNAEMKAGIFKPAIRATYQETDRIKLDGEVNLSRGNQKISVSLRDTDIKQALRMIADRAGMNIIFHSSVKGNITLDLVDVTLNDAFKMIMQAGDMSFIIENDTLLVLSKTESLKSDISKQNMMTIPVKYVDAARVAQFLNENVFATNRPGLSNSRIVVTNPNTNELVLFGTDNDYKMAQKIVEKIDVKPISVNYKVNHSTPKEMAYMICQSLFPNAKMIKDDEELSELESTDLYEDQDELDMGNSTNGASGNNASQSGWSGGAAGIITGGATTDIGAGDTDTTDTDDLEDADYSNTIKLGQAKVACTLRSGVKADKLRSVGRGALTVTYLPQTGVVNLTGASQEQIELVRDFIKQNDKKQPQAYVELQMIELNETGSKEFNNQWDLFTPFFSASFGDTGLNTNEIYPTFFHGHGINYVTPDEDGGYRPLYSVSRYKGPTTLAYSLHYLIENGKGRTLANPKLIVTNGQKSIFRLTSDYIKSTEAQMLSGSYGGTVAGVQKTYTIADDEGISIELVPYISSDGYVTMNIKPAYATQKGDPIMDNAYGQNGNVVGTYIAATLMQRRTLDLGNIRIKDGETLVIGGLIQEREVKQVSKLPFLGDLPLIGSFFRNTVTINEKTELVIVITPRIMKDTEDIASDDNNNTELL